MIIQSISAKRLAMSGFAIRPMAKRQLLPLTMRGAIRRLSTSSGDFFGLFERQWSVYSAAVARLPTWCICSAYWYYSPFPSNETHLFLWQSCRFFSVMRTAGYPSLLELENRRYRDVAKERKLSGPVETAVGRSFNER